MLPKSKYCNAVSGDLDTVLPIVDRQGDFEALVLRWSCYIILLQRCQIRDSLEVNDMVETLHHCTTLAHWNVLKCFCACEEPVTGLREGGNVTKLSQHWHFNHEQRKKEGSRKDGEQFQLMLMHPERVGVFYRSQAKIVMLGIWNITERFWKRETWSLQ